jgi:hypothetical protein
MKGFIAKKAQMELHSLSFEKKKVFSGGSEG